MCAGEHARVLKIYIPTQIKKFTCCIPACTACFLVTIRAKLLLYDMNSVAAFLHAQHAFLLLYGRKYSHYSPYPRPFSPSPLSNILHLQSVRLKSTGGGGVPSPHAPYSKEPETPSPVTSTRTQ